MKKTFDIGKVHIENPVVVAPLAGVSNIAFEEYQNDLERDLYAMKWSVIKLYTMHRKKLLKCVGAIPMNILSAFSFLVMIWIQWCMQLNFWIHKPIAISLILIWVARSIK